MLCDSLRRFDFFFSSTVLANNKIFMVLSSTLFCDIKFPIGNRWNENHVCINATTGVYTVQCVLNTTQLWWRILYRECARKLLCFLSFERTFFANASFRWFSIETFKHSCCEIMENKFMSRKKIRSILMRTFLHTFRWLASFRGHLLAQPVHYWCPIWAATQKMWIYNDERR